MDSKSQINTYCQRANLTPSYNTFILSTGLFKCKLEVGEVSAIGFGNTKKQAHQDAATTLLNALTRPKPVPVAQTDPNIITSIVMIDGENLQKAHLEVKPTENRKVIHYLSKMHHLIEEPIPPGVERRISPSTRSDGCDIFMAMDAVRLLSECPNVTEIVILSRDKFASAVADNLAMFKESVQCRHEFKI